MSSDLFIYDNSEIILPYDTNFNFFSDDPFSPFSDSAIDDIFQELSHQPNNQNPVHDQPHSLKQVEIFTKDSNFEVKNEDFHHVDYDNAYNWLQRSYSTGSFDNKTPEFFYQPQFDSISESPSFHNQVIPGFNENNNNLFDGQMRRVCSAGDLQRSGTQSSLTEEGNSKGGRYSAEERRERISKYRAKRTQRNFNKTIKYACRKTLADNRPRIRGRFARYDETYDFPKSTPHAHQDHQSSD